ncbi:hypothetical protein WA026_003583, partial [Henosepilachna vigintioctopunctata]
TATQSTGSFDLHAPIPITKNPKKRNNGQKSQTVFRNCAHKEGEHEHDNVSGMEWLPEGAY